MDPPDSTARGFELGDVGLPHSIALGWSYRECFSAAQGELFQLAQVLLRLQHRQVTHRTLNGAHRHSVRGMPMQSPDLPMPPMCTLRRQALQHCASDRALGLRPRFTRWLVLASPPLVRRIRHSNNVSKALLRNLEFDARQFEPKRISRVERPLFTTRSSATVSPNAVLSCSFSASSAASR